MNFMSDKLKSLDIKIKTTNYPTNENNEIIKNSAVKVCNNNTTFYFLNKLPIIPEFRDVCIKPTSISIIKANLENKSDVDIHTLPSRYCFTFTTCMSPYTKASMKYQHQFIIMFDKESTCEEYKQWFETCFKTIQEQESEKENKDKEIAEYKKIIELKQALKKLEDK